eukprot:548070_1
MIAITMSFSSCFTQLNTMGRKGVISVTKADEAHINYFYATSIGSIIAFILLLILFIHILYHYIIIFHSKKSKKEETSSDHNKAIYILFLLLLTISMIMCLSNGLIKSNYFTQIQFTHHKKLFCYISYYLDIGTLQFHQLIMYSLFIHRIQIIFQDTIYEYSQRTFYYIYISLFIGYIIIAASMGAAHKYSKFIIYYFEHENNLYCRTSTQTNSNIFTRISMWIYSIWQITLNIICVYMLVNRLWSLKQSLMQQFATKNILPMCRVQSDTAGETVTNNNEIKHSSTLPIDSFHKTEVSTSECKRVYSLDIIKPKHSVQITMDEIKEEIKKGDKEAETIIALHKLIQKITILVILSILAWIIFFILIKISPWFWTQKIWFIVANDVIVWFMLSHAQTYWDCVANCFCCYCLSKCKIM